LPWGSPPVEGQTGKDHLSLMLLCYLDDSGKDPQNPITTIAGYIARDVAWPRFEAEVETWFTAFGVRVLHAKELHDTDGDFAGWSKLRKQAFISRVCQARQPHVMMGLSMSALKGTYAVRAAESGRKRTVTPYCFCFNVIVDWILRDIRLGKFSNSEGVAFVIESGHENNDEAEQEFYAVRRLHGIEHLLHSIKFVPKDDCRAIQLADVLAFYSRRDGVAMERAQRECRPHVPEDMLKVLVETTPHRGFVATDFGPNSPGRPFWSLPPDLPIVSGSARMEAGADP
jgi:hypothetical protein